MLRIPVGNGGIKNSWIRYKSSSSSIRSTFIEYFKENHGHKHVKSSSVVPLCDPSVPFVNAGMNQFKGVFLGQVAAPCARAVNSQKCIRVGGKHNDLEVVGTDGTHHTFFEMLGNWSFGDYYKKEACEMAWQLLTGPYQLQPEELVVTYFAGDAGVGLPEDTECRDIWRAIGVANSRLKALGVRDNLWEMGGSGPCGPCSEIHHVNQDGTLTELWNIVFIQCNRELDGSVTPLARQHVDTGMGLERMAALLQRVPSNYDTDLFRPIISAIEKNSKGVNPYGGKYGADAVLDSAYRRLADHARMISVCLADGAFPAANLNLRQIMRKSYKLSSDVFRSPGLLSTLYSEVAAILGTTYPELVSKQDEARLIMEHEMDSYARLRSQMAKRWKGLVGRYPEVERMADVELPSFAQGYTEFKEAMGKKNSSLIPAEVVFKLYDTHGFQEDIIQRIADLNNLAIDNEGFHRLLTQHKSRHKAALKEQSSNRGQLFNNSIEKLVKNGTKSTNDQHKYDCKIIENEPVFESLKTKLVAILNEDCEWIDISDPSDNRIYYLVTEDTNFYCEEGGQVCDTGIIRINENVSLNVDNVFKIRDFVFHKGRFTGKGCVKCNSDVILNIDSDRRFKIMQNHTGVHLLNAAIRKVLPNSVVCQIGSGVSEKGLYLNLSVYGEKLSQEVVLKAQDLIRAAIEANVSVSTQVMNSVHLPGSVLSVPGECYPETGLRVVSVPAPLPSKELCCGCHVSVTGALRDMCVTVVKGAAGHSPLIHALTGDAAREARELFCRAEKLSQVIHLVEPARRRREVGDIRGQLAALCGGSGAPYYKTCVTLLDSLLHAAEPAPADMCHEALQMVANTEVQEAVGVAAREGRAFVVHFLRCSYLMQEAAVSAALAECARASSAPAVLLLGCAGGVIVAGAAIPQDLVSAEFTASRWLSCVLPVFRTSALPGATHSYAEMTPTKVSLINCEQLVQDAMRVAVKYAKSHARSAGTGAGGERPQNRQQN